MRGLCGRQRSWAPKNRGKIHDHDGRSQERPQARFQLKERLARALVAHPQDSSAEEQPLSGLVDTEEIDEEYEVPVSQLEGPDQPQRQKLRAQFGRRRTHNEQIIVAHCGIIIARETIYGAEGVASVVVSF